MWSVFWRTFPFLCCVCCHSSVAVRLLFPPSVDLLLSDQAKGEPAQQCTAYVKAKSVSSRSQLPLPSFVVQIFVALFCMVWCGTNALLTTSVCRGRCGARNIVAWFRSLFVLQPWRLSRTHRALVDPPRSWVSQACLLDHLLWIAAEHASFAPCRKAVILSLCVGT